MNVAALAAGTMIALGGAAAPAFADSDANGVAANSPGVVSGNDIQVPVNVPVNLCGDTVDVIGLLDPAFGTTCVDAD
jgi:hypothetical protein